MEAEVVEEQPQAQEELERVTLVVVEQDQTVYATREEVWEVSFLVEVVLVWRLCRAWNVSMLQKTVAGCSSTQRWTDWEAVVVLQVWVVPLQVVLEPLVVGVEGLRFAMSLGPRGTVNWFRRLSLRLPSSSVSACRPQTGLLTEVPR